MNIKAEINWSYDNFTVVNEEDIKGLNESIANFNIKIEHPSQLNETAFMIQEKLDGIITLLAKLYYLVDGLQPTNLVKCLQAKCRVYCSELEGSIQDVADFDEVPLDQAFKSVIYRRSNNQHYD